MDNGNNKYSIVCKNFYEWEIKNFNELSTKKVDPYHSNSSFGTYIIHKFSFLRSNCKFIWRLYLYFNNDEENENKDWISMYLKMESSYNRKIEMQGLFFIVNNVTKAREYIKEVNKTFESGNVREGFDQFIKKDQLMKQKDKLLTNDTLTVGVEFTINHDNFRSMTMLAKNPIAESIKALYETRRGYDVIITVQNRKFKAHKTILIARCPVFSAMFAKVIKEGHECQLSITDIEANTFDKLLEFIYTDEVTDLDTDAIDLLEAAEKYQLRMLKEMCEVSIFECLSIENSVKSLTIAERVNSKNLAHEISHFIAENAASVIETKDFANFEEENPSVGLMMFKYLAECNKNKNF
ncbi:speckle-type POZ protein [Microplitis demolitor]|uniref:speckle-type POZ protein n=1 Tax=Microplitis demolitor TaxID=69319 RepID=UPI0004CD980F|nr:speckle-type POZ protein [Microplitis demolitor]XP_014297226.1 speckle-type POZ protein [Microplitis demolitor]